MSSQIDVTLNFGFCHFNLHPNSYELENFTKNYDKYDYIGKSGYSPFDFDIDKIFYTETNEYIESLKIIYKNNRSGKSILLETPKPEKTEEIKSIEFKKFEKIINVKMWFKDEKLIGFEMKTDHKRELKIGYGKNGEEINIPEFENDRKIILGIGVHATKKRVTGIYFYFIDRKEYLKIFDPCLLELKAKLKMDKKFKESIDKRKNELNKKNKLLVDICELPNAIFFSIATYFSYH